MILAVASYYLLGLTIPHVGGGYDSASCTTPFYLIISRLSKIHFVILLSHTFSAGGL